MLLVMKYLNNSFCVLLTIIIFQLVQTSLHGCVTQYGNNTIHTVCREHIISVVCEFLKRLRTFRINSNSIINTDLWLVVSIYIIYTVLIKHTSLLN